MPTPDRTLRHAALGVLTAMIVSTIPHSAGSFGLTVPVVAGLVATTLAARRLSNFAAVIVIGVTATTVLELIVG